MFFWTKALLLASLVVTASAYLQQGVYRISSTKSKTTLRSHVIGAPIYVTDANEDPGLNELWLVKRVTRSPEGFFTLENLGLSAFAALNDGTGDLVATTYTAQQGFFIQDVGDNDTYTIKVPGLQSAWNIESPLTHGYVRLRNTTGTGRQRWCFKSAITPSL